MMILTHVLLKLEMLVKQQLNELVIGIEAKKNKGDN